MRPWNVVHKESSREEIFRNRIEIGVRSAKLASLGWLAGDVSGLAHYNRSGLACLCDRDYHLSTNLACTRIHRPTTCRLMQHVRARMYQSSQETLQ